MDISEFFVKDCSKNLIQNGGMEIGDPPTGWDIRNTPEIFERSAVQKYSGSYSAHVNDSIASQAGFSQSVIGVAGKKYKVSFWYYLISGMFHAYIWDQVTVQGDTVCSTVGSWQYVEFLVTPAPGIDFYFLNTSATVAAEFYIDDVSICEI